MNCPKCGSNQTKVSWSGSEPKYVKRRRVCLKCNYRYNTIEWQGCYINKIKSFAKKLKGPHSANELKQLADLIEGLPETYTDNEENIFIE